MDYSEVYNITIGNFQGERLITWFKNGEKHTAGGKEYAAITDSVAAVLEKKFSGIEKGSWIGLKSNNHYLWLAVFFGLLKIGYPVLLLDANASEDSLEAFTAQSHMKAIVTDTPESHGDMLNVSMAELEECTESSPENVCWE